MKQKIHIAAGMVGFFTLMTFWGATVITGIFGSPQAVATAKTAILWGMLVLLPSMIVVGASGMSMGARR